MKDRISRRSERMQFLRQVVEKREPELLPLVGLLGFVPLTTEQREQLRDIIGDELCETGLQEDSEPNGRGLQLEDLIDTVGHL